MYEIMYNLLSDITARNMASKSLPKNENPNLRPKARHIFKYGKESTFITKQYGL